MAPGGNVVLFSLFIRLYKAVDSSIGAKCHLSALCFADDVLLMASSTRKLKTMMQDIMHATASRGLTVHEGKTVVLTNADATASCGLPPNLNVDGRIFQVAGSLGTTKWLGRKIRFHDPQELELSSHIASARGAFTKHKEELTSRRFRLKDRLKLFTAVVTSTVLYGCEAWTLKLDQQRRLRSVQRKMLRMVLNAKRWKLKAHSSESSQTEASDEDESDALVPWPEFLTCTARWTEEQLKRAGQTEWLAT